MAIYHFNVKVLSRARGHRVVAAAAALAAARLRDEYYGVLHNHTRRTGVVFSEILAPEGAPAWVFERECLWNRVEAAERRKDAQLARAVEISLPAELSHAQQIALLREFLLAEFVAKGMIADAGIRRNELGNPNAQVLLTLRAASATGFGPKMRQWNVRSNLLDWRSAWAERANFHLASAGHCNRIDHRTLDDQQVELTPSRRTGARPERKPAKQLPPHLQTRFDEQRAIAHANGAAIIEDAVIAIRALAQQRRSFDAAAIGVFLSSRTDGDSQYREALAAVMASSELYPLGQPDDRGQQYTSRDLIEAKNSLLRRALVLSNRRAATVTGTATGTGAATGTATGLGNDTGTGAGIGAATAMAMATATGTGTGTAAVAPTSAGQGLARPPSSWSPTLCAVHARVWSGGDFHAFALPDGEARALRHESSLHWNSHGKRVLDRIPGGDDAPLAKDDVLIMMGAESIDLKPLERILAAVERARAKLVLIADAARLSAMGSMSPMHELIRVGRE